MAARCNTDMLSILIKVGLDEFADNFYKQKVSPYIVYFLSAQKLRQLGLSRKEEIIKLRMECIKYESTVYRMMRQNDITKVEFSTMNDDEISIHIGKVKKEFPFCGENILRQILKLRGVYVQRWRLRDIIHYIDEKGIEERKNGCLQRRVYNVEGPNHLWHIDANHKLIRCHMIIAGGIDGFSRLIVYLQCKDNNRSETIFQCFLTAVENFGIPQQVRSDKGLENVSVANYMMQQRGTGRGSMITGKSVHNQRIERLWRDVYLGVVVFYYNLFYFMEDEGILDPLNGMHIAALHSTFFPKINEKLDIWKEAWAKHRMRTVHSSPRTL
ncbi:hypothetical protein CHS0354_036993 [Potamilus streckersoni]|uniref:Integrase catalytic domain-containing protein n=1 Tax=Potamilus streckersoni TaxID=2493646 RepID=A0AAE0SKA1_9BIVA|nr:hypothetical protein CHS0354_036993 [Potamilus streckersoni]